MNDLNVIASAQELAANITVRPGPNNVSLFNGLEPKDYVKRQLVPSIPDELLDRLLEELKKELKLLPPVISTPRWELV